MFSSEVCPQRKKQNGSLIQDWGGKLIFLTLILSGCTTQLTNKQTTLEETPLNVQTKPASNIRAWELKGLIGVRHAKKASSAQVVWSQNGPNHYHIRLYGPLGGGTAIIDKSNGIVTYQTGHQKAQAKRASTLMKQATGISLPIESLYYWVRGLPKPGSIESSQRGPHQSLLTLKQSDYTINYTKHQLVDGYILPTKITLQGQGMLIKFVIKSWKVY